MAYEPMPLPYWSVASWNPNVNEARANGEYPTAGWANQLQALHTETIEKVNEVGALADGVADSVGVLGESHTPGTILIAGADGYLKALPPGTYRKVLQPDANLADGVSWRHLGSSDTPAKGDILAFDGTEWRNVTTTAVVSGAFLRYDTLSPTNVSWASDDSATAKLAYYELVMGSHPSIVPHPAGTKQYVSRRLDGKGGPLGELTFITRRGLTFAAGTDLLLATLPPGARPTATRTLTRRLRAYQPNGTELPSETHASYITINTNGEIRTTLTSWGTICLTPGTSDEPVTFMSEINNDSTYIL